MILDDIDHKLVQLLRLNARSPNSALAIEAGLSASGCLQRIRLLEKKRRHRRVYDRPGENDDFDGVNVYVR